MSIATLATLEQADFTVEQARALTRVLEEDHHNLATKEDINSLRMATKEDINSLRIATKNDINSLKMATKNDIRLLEATMATKEETQAIREDIKDIQGDIKSLENRMATKEETQAIREDIKDIRGDIKAIEAKIDGNTKSLEAKIDGNTKSLEAKMATKTELDKTTRYLTRWIVIGIFLNTGTLALLLKYLLFS